MNDHLQSLNHFLQVPTPDAWLEIALNNIPLLLQDHAHCERKAAMSALNFISKYPELPELVAMMSPLAREELLHFEKVLDIMRARSIPFGPLPSCQYAQKLHNLTEKNVNKERLRDQLIIGAIIEARSCERFNALVGRLKDPVLCRFYSSLVKSEARHFEAYLHLANLYFDDAKPRIDYFLAIENELISKDDTVFRFHSGIPR